MSHSIAACLSGLVLAAALAPPAQGFQESERPLTEQGYCGLALTDIADGHTVVSWIYPGPLDGQGISARGVDLARPDLVVSVDGRSMNAETFRDYVRSKSPGDVIELATRKANQRSASIPKGINHEAGERLIRITLESREEWMGTVGRARQSDRKLAPGDAPLLRPFETGNALGEAVRAHDLEDPLRQLLGVFTDRLSDNPDTHLLSYVAAGFDDPFALDQLQGRLSRRARAAAANSSQDLVPMVRDALDLEDTAAPGDLDPVRFSKTHGTIPDCMQKAAQAIRDARSVLEQALEDRAGDEQFAQQCIDLLRVPRRTFYIDGPDSKAHIGVIRASIGVSFDQLISAGETIFQLQEVPLEFDPDGIGIEPTGELAEFVEGPILAAAYSEDAGWIVVGSKSANRYDMAAIHAVIDPGGDDEYAASGLRLGARIIIDLAGDDRYSGTPEQGPGSALLGCSLIDDRAGDDQYEGEMLACGSAMFGFALLRDRAGNDTYAGTDWSLGAACYGAGIILDQSRGGDTYLGDLLCEGVGGPRGLGAIIDDGGRDLYRANGPTESAYGTPAVYQSFSQGMGFGFRSFAHGGIGMLCDLGGDDRYEAGEFAQGGAYYYGLGVLHDANGRDVYYGNRYGQGFGVHQAHGVLCDEAGDDVYWSMTAANQGAAWDIGAGLLLDRAGNDSYQCDGLGQGGASMQAIGMLVDLGGTDRYAARGGAVQGQSGGDSYHYLRTGAYSFSVLMDLGGETDWYSTGRANDATASTGRPNENAPENSSLHGLIVDQ